MSIVAMPAFQVAPSHEPAGANAILCVEGVTHESIADGESRQATPGGGFIFGRIHPCTLAHATGESASSRGVVASMPVRPPAQAHRVVKIKRCIDESDV